MRSRQYDEMYNVLLGLADLSVNLDARYCTNKKVAEVIAGDLLETIRELDRLERYKFVVRVRARSCGCRYHYKLTELGRRVIAEIGKQQDLYAEGWTGSDSSSLNSYFVF